MDYGAGNIRSVLNALEEIGAGPTVVTDPDALREASRIILPGVGAMNHAMRRLRESGLDQVLDEVVRGRGVPYLGICVGMQLMAEVGWEGERTEPED